MKSLTSFFFLLLIFSSCKKQELGSDHPLVGKWQLNNLDALKIEDCFFSLNGYAYNKTEMHITSKGEIIVSYAGEDQKFKIKEITHTIADLEFLNFGNISDEYTCKVRDSKGQIFTFRFYFDNSTDQMVGTYWTPSHLYHTTRQPSCTTISCELWSPTRLIEYFAKYTKI